MAVGVERTEDANSSENFFAERPRLIDAVAQHRLDAGQEGRIHDVGLDHHPC